MGDAHAAARRDGRRRHGRPPVAADVVISGDLIDAVEPEGSVSASTVDEVIDLDGLVSPRASSTSAHPLRRPDPLGPGPHAVGLARGHHRRHGQLRLRHRADPARGPEDDRADPGERRGHDRSRRSTPGIPWTFETFPEYLDAVAASRCGSTSGACSATRRCGSTSWATASSASHPGEVGGCADLTSARRSTPAPSGSRHRCRRPTSGPVAAPCPSRFADHRDEVIALARAARRRRPAASAAGDRGPACPRRRVRRLSPCARPPGHLDGAADGHEPPARPSTSAARRGRRRRLWPQVACRPIVMQLDLADPFAFGTRPPSRRSSACPGTARADAVRRRGVASARRRRPTRVVVGPVGGDDGPGDRRSIPSSSTAATARRCAAAAATDPFDVMRRPLAGREPRRPGSASCMLNDDEDGVGPAAGRPRTLVALSDAGAHASQLCDACFSTHLLRHWVRGAAGAHAGAGRPAPHRPSGGRTSGFRTGAQSRPAASPTSWPSTPTRSASGPLERVWDLPAGADRLIARSTGVEHVWVGGVAVRRDGADVDGARPGRLLRA